MKGKWTHTKGSQWGDRCVQKGADVASDVSGWAGLGSKARAWAGLCQAWACRNVKPSPLCGLGLGPGLPVAEPARVRLGKWHLTVRVMHGVLFSQFLVELSLKTQEEGERTCSLCFKCTSRKQNLIQ